MGVRQRSNHGACAFGVPCLKKLSIHTKNHMFSRLEPGAALAQAAASSFKSNALSCFGHPLYAGEELRSVVVFAFVSRLGMHGLGVPKVRSLVADARQSG